MAELLPEKPHSIEIEVTTEMIEAGMTELRDHVFGGDLRYMLASVYREMEYARLELLRKRGSLGDQ